MFVLNSDISIGGFRFKGVHDVRIEQSLNSVVNTAVITIPSIAKIIKNGNRSPQTVITGSKFNDGDPVSIDLGYNEELRMEFKGFVNKRDLGMPLRVSCEGYSWLLRRNKVNISKQSVTIADYLKAAIAGIDTKYPINIQCTVDYTLNNVQVNGTGLDAINSLYKYTDGTISCFFIQPDILWCGLIYTAYANGNDILNNGEVKYRLGYNVLKDNSLKQRSVADDPVEVRYNKKLSAGTKLTQASDAFKKFSRTHSRILNQIREAAALKSLANEKAYKMNYTGYEGAVHTFLQPFCAPGWKAGIQDSRYPLQDGTYLVESVTTHFGVNGAKRIVEIGPQIGFANK